MRIAIACAALAACTTEHTVVEPRPSLNRMLVQPRVDPFAESTFFADRSAMRTPPAGTVPYSTRAGDLLVERGIERGVYAQRIPIAVNEAFVALGRARFDNVCANCHGVLGDGVSAVAEQMRLRTPASLHEADARTMPDGKLFSVITGGYGLMPSQASSLSVNERWAVVAYVRALELSQFARVTDLPETVRAELAREEGSL